ncbi:uncharacterized protein [Elaeis guineensis]|uniref:uncharacterized protein n=1 Tax=Elaeis guineensis var. tenera TaxID=51953 RepID=UPI003C6CE8EE
MGIWESLRWTAGTFYGSLPDPSPVKDFGLGVVQATASSVSAGASRARDLLHRAADKAHSKAPDLTPVATIGRGAVSKMDHAVRVEGLRRMKSAMPDQDGWQWIGRIGLDLIDHTLAQVTKPYTGGIPVYRIVKEGWTKGRSGPAAHAKEEEELQELRNKIARLEMAIADGDRRGPHSRRPESACWLVGLQPHQKPEDVIRVFMMKGFKGGDFIDAQVVPRAGNAKATPY